MQFDHSFDMVQPKHKWAINKRCVHHVPQVVLKRISGANTLKSALSGNHVPAQCVTSSSEEDKWCKVQTHGKVHLLETMSLHHVSQVVLKRINDANPEKSALSRSHIPASCVTSSSEEDQWCKHTEKGTFSKPYPCTMYHK